MLEIGQPIQLHSGFHHLPLHRHFLDHDSVDRSIDAHGSLRLACLFQLGDLIVGNVKQLQLLSRTGFQSTGALAEGEHILVLRAVKFRRINVE